MPTVAIPWRAEQLRITLFSPAIGTRFEAGGLWRVATENDAPRSTRTPGTMEEAGPTGVEGEWLVARATPGRLDLILSSPPEDQVASAALALLSGLPAYKARIRELGAKLVGVVGGEPSRIAFGSVLMVQAETKEAGYTQLGTLLEGSVVLDPASSDFLYQVNRPRREKFSDEQITLNRLTKWSVAMQQRVQMYLSPGSAPLTQAVTLIYASRLELDMSTDANRQTALPAGTSGQILDTLFDLGSEIAEQGDIK